MASISVPFKFNEFGEVASNINESDYWKNQILLTLMTRFGERVMRPSFGSSIGEAIFEPMESVGEVAVRAINNAFSVWLPTLTLNEVSPELDEDENSVMVTVNYTLPSGKSDTITLNTAIFNRTGDILEEIPSGQ